MSIAVMRSIIKVLAKRNKINNMISGITPEEMAYTQKYICISIGESIQEFTGLSDGHIHNVLEDIYELEPMTARQISDHIFDEPKGRRVNKITPMMLGKNFLPQLYKDGKVSIIRGAGEAKYKLVSFESRFRE